MAKKAIKETKYCSLISQSVITDEEYTYALEKIIVKPQGNREELRFSVYKDQQRYGMKLKEYIEEYVLTELEARIFNDKAITMLVEGINENLKKQSQGDEDKRGVIEKELKDIEKQIGNIVMAITNGFIQEEFKIKMEELKERKVYLEGKLVDIEASQSVTKVTEEDIRSLLTGFKEYVVTKNIPECKNFIQNFVKEVIVYKTHVEVVFNVGLNMFKNDENIVCKCRVNRTGLLNVSE